MSAPQSRKMPTKAKNTRFGLGWTVRGRAQRLVYSVLEV